MKRSEIRQKNWLDCRGWEEGFPKLVVIISTVLMMLGCSANNNQKETIAALEREVARLRSEKANLDAHSTALDDKIVVLEKRLEKCDRKKGPSLSVVRLGPDTVADVEETSLDEDEGFAEAAHEDSRGERRAPEKRPLLVLDHRGRERHRTPSIAADRPGAAGISSAGFNAVGADNLGVVQSEGQPTGGVGSTTGMDLFNEAYLAYSNKSYAAALEGFARFVNANSSHNYADNAMYWRGECYLAQGKLTKAIGEFERLTRRYPNSEKVPAAIYRIGYVYDKLRDYGKAAEYYFKVVERYPKSDEARRASRRVAEIKNRNGNPGGFMPTSATR